MTRRERQRENRRKRRQRERELREGLRREDLIITGSGKRPIQHIDKVPYRLFKGPRFKKYDP